MPIKKAKKRERTEQFLELYAGGTISLQSSSQTKEDTLVEIINALPDSFLEAPKTIDTYATRIHDARRGNYPKGELISLEQIGRLLGVSGAAICKKEKGLEPVDRDDLLCFCLLYQVTPHYLVGLTSDPVEYIAVPEMQRVLGINKGAKNIDSECFEVPMSFPPTSIRERAQLIIFHIFDEAEIYDAFIRLASSNYDKKLKTISRFRDLNSIESSPIDDAVNRVQTDEFQNEEWTRFVQIEKGELEREKIRKDMAVLEQLGMENFEFLDVLARVAISTKKVKENVAFLIEESDV